MPLTRRELRGRLAAATRWGNEDEAAAIKSQLVALCIEGDIRKRMDGQPPLTEAQVNRLCEVLTEYAAPLEMTESLEALPAQIEALTTRLREMAREGQPIDLHSLDAPVA